VGSKADRNRVILYNMQMKIPQSLDRFKLSFREVLFLLGIVVIMIGGWYKINMKVIVLQVNMDILQCQIEELTDFQTKGIAPARECWEIAIKAFKKGTTDFLIN